MMSTHHDATRKRALTALAAIAGGLALLLILTGLLSGFRAATPERIGEPVLGEFSAISGEIKRIKVRLADERYTLEATEDGWVMPEAGGYPVRADRLAALAEGLGSLTWEAERTRDPDKFDRIGLGDPSQDGTGALIEIVNDAGETTFSLIAGRKAGRVYGRRPDDAMAYRLSGDLPPLYTKDAWLDFQIVDIQPEAIAAVRLTDWRGAAIFLRRNAGEPAQAFRPGPPDQDRRLTSAIAAAGPALALARFAPLDAKRADQLETPPVARHVTLTFDGLEVAVEAYREPDGLFVTMRAVEAGEGARRAETINQRAGGWAFRLTDLDWSEYTTPIDQIVRPLTAPEDEAEPGAE